MRGITYIQRTGLVYKVISREQPGEGGLWQAEDYKTQQAGSSSGRRKCEDDSSRLSEMLALGSPPSRPHLPIHDTWSRSCLSIDVSRVVCSQSVEVRKIENSIPYHHHIFHWIESCCCCCWYLLLQLLQSGLGIQGLCAVSLGISSLSPSILMASWK